ncbi:hypothetical protein GH811_15280 [Acetobacterium malicum]|uniref:Uncharacterized protein n=1 Tax=Acetobacterium malicum TaxID=52692 RepID=A0ABR6Z0D9_9FIRM|nr:hypothetical protein [Acetobacterium malicum]MBC3900978.1 hypothetical protein [Acetobacterium malicum]
MDMWSKESIEKELDKLSKEVISEMKERFLNSQREEFKPPESIEILVPSILTGIITVRYKSLISNENKEDKKLLNSGTSEGISKRIAIPLLSNAA